MRFFLEAYYVMRLNDYWFAPPPGHHLFTVCQDFNDNLLGYWAYLYGDLTPMGHTGWYHYDGTNLAADDTALKEKLQLPDLDPEEIRIWVTKKYEAGNLGWERTFADLETAKEYRDKFFGHVPDTYILSVSFLEAEVEDILQDIKYNRLEYSNKACERITDALLAMSNEKGKVIGYDIIGNSSFDLGDLVLDSFLVHNIGKDISSRFGVELNEYGLLKDTTRMEEIMDYMNDPESGTEPHPWSWVQVKLFD